MHEMSDREIEQVMDLVATHVAEELDFESMRITAVDKIDGDPTDSVPRYRVKVSLTYSSERISQFVAEGGPVEAEVSRCFVEGEFKLTVEVRGNKIVDTDWENIQFS
jgi:hypothetical protein